MNNQADQVVRVGVLGLGFMGATHVAAYQSASRDGFPCRLVAVCDTLPRRREGFLADVGGNLRGSSDPKPAFDPAQVRGYADAEELLADASVDLVSICTQTDTHAELAIRALRAGKHVLVEKPVALSLDEVRKVERAARESGRLCMPAMCMRFWPAWNWLRQRIKDESFGPCTALTLTRIGSAPSWSPEFYADPARSGGALVDLHIHDSDFVRFCFGQPHSVCSAGGYHGAAINHVTTIYRFAGPHAPPYVVAEGAWLAPGTAFRMRFVAGFERATADFELGRDPELVVYHAGDRKTVEVSSLSGYDQEVRHLVQAIAAGETTTVATMEDAIAVTELLDAERRSIEARTIISL
jgi:predicted dehydrogenase